MNQLKWDVVNRVRTKTDTGQATYAFEATRTFYSSPKAPAGSPESVKAYGFDPLLSFKIHTRDQIQANEFIRTDNVVFHIKRVETYPRHKLCFIEEVK